MAAYRAVRQSQNLWGSWQVWGSEEQMLSGLVMDILKRVMADIYDAIPKGPAKNAILKTVKTTATMVRTGVSAAYSGDHRDQGGRIRPRRGREGPQAAPRAGAQIRREGLGGGQGQDPATGHDAHQLGREEDL